jgi:hypothetical protein
MPHKPTKGNFTKIKDPNLNACNLSATFHSPKIYGNEYRFLGSHGTVKTTHQKQM